MQLFRKQIDSVLKANSFLNFWVGPVRSGKTFASIIRWIKFVGEYRGKADLVMLGRTAQTLYRNIIKPIENMLGDACHYSSAKNEFEIFDKICYTIGVNDERAEGKIRGLTAGGAYGDEVVLWPFNCFQMLMSRLSEKESKFFGTTNPDSPFHPVKTDYIDKAHSFDMSIFEFDFDDNIFLPTGFKEQLKSMYTGMWYKRFILGQWCQAEGAIFDFFDENEHTLTVCPEAEYHILAVDYGTSNPFAALLFGFNHRTKPKVWAEREYYFDSKKEGRQKTDEEYSKDLKKFVRQHLGEHWLTRLRKIYIDPSAESFQIQLERDGFAGISHADNAVIDGLRTVARMLKSREYAISIHCPNYIKEMFSYVWDQARQRLGIDMPKKESDHCQDAGRYCIHSEFGGSQVDLYALTRM